MSVSTGVEPTVDSVVEAIDSLESIKTRANEQKMITYLIKKYRLKTSSARDLINEALAEGYIDRLDSGSYIVSVQCKQPLEGSQHLNLNTKNKFKSKMEMETKCDSKEENTIPDGASLLANQTITGAQKRQKRQAIAPVVMQRIRPISKRKKFKKSLGPDFLEPAELGMQYLRDTYEPKCDVCSLTMFSSSTSLNVFEELLHCNNCDAKAHPSCVNLNDEIAHKTQWQCHNCKVCTVCRRTDTNEFVIICMTCSKGFHVKCHLTAIVNRPKGNWYCKHCCSKGTTNSSHLTNGLIDKKVLYASDDSMQSENNNGVEPTDKEDRNLNIVLENESNCELNDKDMDNCDDSVDGLKDDIPCVEETEDIVVNQTECVSESIEMSNGIDCLKEESAGEDMNDVDNEVDNESNAIPESAELNRSVNSTVSPQKWSVEEVETFIRESGFPVESKLFKEQEIDGSSLLLLRRMDVLTGLSLKLGPALKIYNKISRLQGREPIDHSNSC